MKRIALVSACLLGIPTRYDGTSEQNDLVLALKNKYYLIPFCPEQLGGLSTPRDPSERCGQKAITNKGEDVTEGFLKGAKISLSIAKSLVPDIVILKEYSPSCGVNVVYDGTFCGKKVKGQGFTAEMLKKHFTVVSEEELAGLMGP